MNELTEIDIKHLNHCLELAKEALLAGDEPFGSILVNDNNEVIALARNRVNERNVLAHPELELAHWAADNLSSAQRKTITMYTSGEHCTMCAATHGWVGLGKLVYLSSGKQLNEWLVAFGVAEAPIKFMSVQEIIKNIEVRGPADEGLVKEIKALHKTYHSNRNNNEK